MHLPLTTLTMTVVHTVAPDMPLDTAIQTLVRQHVDLVNVVEDGKLIGVLSVRDIVMRVGRSSNGPARPVAQLERADGPPRHSGKGVFAGE